MEAFSLTAAAGWQLLSDLLTAAGYTGPLTWKELYIINTHAANTMIVKPNGDTTAPAVDSGINLGPAKSQQWYSGPIAGKKMWIKASAAGTTFDVTFSRV